MNSYGHNNLLFLMFRVRIVDNVRHKVNCVPVLWLYLIKRKPIAGLLSSAVVVAQGQQGGNIYALEAV